MAKCIERPRTTCAQGGALATIASLPKVVAISHAGEGCGGNLTNAIAACSGYSGEGYCSGPQVPSSAVREKHVVFGGAKRLTEEIEAAEELIDANLFVVVTGCTTEMIGDDIFAVVREFENAKTPVIGVNTPSFSGDAYSGYEIVIDGIFNKYLQPVEESEKDSKLINIFGIIPNFDPFYRGDLEEIKRILEKVGLKVNTFFTPDQTFDNILSAPKAALNINFSHVWAVNFNKKFSQIHKTKVFETDLPIGAVATENFLRELATYVDIDAEILEKVIAEENDRYYEYFTRTVDLITNSQFFFYGSVITNSNYALPLAKYLDEELSWRIGDVIVTDILPKIKQKRINAAFDDSIFKGKLLLETDAKQIEWSITKNHPRNEGDRYFNNEAPQFILGSTYDKYLANNIGAKTLAVSYPITNRLIVNKGYAGFNGGLNLLEDIIGVLVIGR